MDTGSNRVESSSGLETRSYSYDAAGNTLSDGSRTYGYDDSGRLVTASYQGVTTSYVYNGLGERVKKAHGSVTRYFAYDEAGQLLGEYDGQGELVQETVWFGDIPVATLRPDGARGIEIYYVHTDHLNTPRRVTRSGDNTLVWRWQSTPFGGKEADEDPDGDQVAFTYNLRFPGQYRDAETGLHYNYFRTYDPSTGRYLESDPIGLLGGMNTYGYVLLNPISNSDPFGLDTMSPKEWAEFLDSIDVPSVSPADRIPARSRALREQDRAMAAAIPITAAREAAREGSRNACEILSAEASILGSFYGAGLAGKAIAEAGLRVPSGAEAGRTLCLALSLCSPKVDSAAQQSRVVVESTLDVVRDLRRVDRLKEASDAARQATTHLPK